MEISPRLHWLLSRYHIGFAIIVCLIAAAGLGLAMGEGDFFSVYVGIFGIIMAVITLVLGERYWLIVPFAFTCQLAAVPVRGRQVELPEIAALVCTLVFIIRYALRRQTFVLWRKEHAPMLFFAGWAALIFYLNPVGLSDMGAGSGGARSYVKIAMALAVLIIMANQKIGERECRWIFGLLLFGACLSSVQDVILFFRPIAPTTLTVIDPESYYSWHQALANVPLAIILILFARYRAREIFSLQRFWMLFLFVGCFGVILASGKRSAVASVPFFAVAAAIFRREFGYLFVWLAGAAVAGTILIAGHGTLFHLPLTAQRAVSWLPGQWDHELASYAGGADDFRGMLRFLAKEKIAANPWIGTGFRVDRTLANRLSTTGGSLEHQVLPYAVGSAWHNTWYGYAADFGIPASFMVGVIYLTVLRYSWRTFRLLDKHPWASALALYILLFTVRDVSFAHTTGHTANDAFSRWWMYGTLFSIGIAARDQVRKPEVLAPTAASRRRSRFPGGRPALQPVERGKVPPR